LEEKYFLKEMALPEGRSDATTGTALRELPLDAASDLML
jgi:hypothetical protein